MTASEYHNARKRRCLPFIALGIVTFSGMLSWLIGKLFFSQLSSDASVFMEMIVLLVLSVVLSLGFMAILRRSDDRLEKRHPEMQWTSDWYWAGLPEKDYPTTDEEKRLYASEAATLLWRAARGANAIFAERDELREKVKKCAEGSPERKVLNALLAKASNLANELNQNYLDLHKLFSGEKMSILIDDPYTDPRQYRESAGSN